MFRVLVVAACLAGAAIGAAAPAIADPPYANCKSAAADGRYNILQDDPAYSSKLDRDGDGVACES